VKISKLGIFGIIIIAAWAYFGFPSPDTLLHLSDAKAECVKFAEDNKAKMFFGEDGNTIKAVDMWMKNGKVVVEVGSFSGTSTSYMPRLCVVGGGNIQIVSVLENAAWR
jgi:hypothetical protein